MRERLTATKPVRNRPNGDTPASKTLLNLASIRQKLGLGQSAHGGMGSAFDFPDEVGALKAENRILAAQVEAIRSGANTVLHELDTGMLARQLRARRFIC